MMTETNLLQTAPPVARVERTETTLHNRTLIDDYAWLREKTSPEVLAYLEAENAYTDSVMKSTEPLREILYAEMVSHIKETDQSVPFREGDYFYYSRTEQTRQYPIYCRKKGSIDAPEEIILDVNELAAGEAFMAIGGFTVSDDGNLLAYSTDTTGFRQYTLRVKDLRTGELLGEHAERVGSIEWANDNRTLFYTVEDEEQKRQFQLYRHLLGTSHDQDALVFEETDERFNIGAGKTRDGKYLLLESASHTTSEERFLSADDPAGEWRLIAPRQDDIEYYADHRNGLFYIRTNDKGRNFRLVTAPVDSLEQTNWTEVVSHRAEVMLEDIDLFASFYVACERAEGLPSLRVVRFAGAGSEVGSSEEIRFPEPVYSAHPHTNREFDAHNYRYSYQSLVTPGSVYEYDLATGASTLLKQQEIPGGFDRELYGSERFFATAKDGAKVPVSLVYRRDQKGEGTNPLHVYGYGSYGYSLPIGFNSNRLSLLDRGFVLAYAHIRGGGDMGKSWHDDGRLMNKQNTFSDFIAASEVLLARGYGDPQRVSAEGGSAGGLLMGAVSNLRPDLFRAIVSHVPFVDVMNTMLDASLPLTVPEYEEWGNPNEPAAFEYMLSYSPYDNLQPGSYPAMLVKTSLNDSQVMYWEPAKYVAKLRTLKQNDSLLLLHINMSAGHGGASGRYDYLKEIAFDYAFLLKELGVVAV
ncbi:Protease II [Acidisarcina polymorpha]|uniref:Protease II n=1 Tax=Acidisarcina polymorpha TaxID=2211140 RepID=A0A2Z5G680_9BACT|nr:Protease II [Acidisarcina polymorpha]